MELITSCSKCVIITSQKKMFNAVNIRRMQKVGLLIVPPLNYQFWKNCFSDRKKENIRNHRIALLWLIAVLINHSNMVWQKCGINHHHVEYSIKWKRPDTKAQNQKFSWTIFSKYCFVSFSKRGKKIFLFSISKF